MPSTFSRQTRVCSKAKDLQVVSSRIEGLGMLSLRNSESLHGLHAIVKIGVIDECPLLFEIDHDSQSKPSIKPSQE